MGRRGAVDQDCDEEKLHEVYSQVVESPTEMPTTCLLTLSMLY